METTLKKPLWLTATTLLCFIIVILFVAIGCDKIEKHEEDEVYFYIKIGDIHTFVENASEFDDVVAIRISVPGRNLYRVDLGHFERKDNVFRIALPETLSPNDLHALVNPIRVPMWPLAPNIPETPSTMFISNKDARTVIANFEGMNKHGHPVANFFPIKTDQNGDLIWNGSVHFTYVDSDVTISGYKKQLLIGNISPQSGNVPFERTTYYSIEWKRGWNLWGWTRETFTELEHGEYKVVERWSSPINSWKWFGARMMAL